MEHLPEIGLAFGAFALGMFSPVRISSLLSARRWLSAAKRALH